MSNLRFGSFRDLQLHIISDEQARARAIREARAREDREKAEKLRKTAAMQRASLAKRGIPGPPVVR